VHEDADLLVVDKPPGMISARPDDQTGKTLFHRVKQYVRRRPGRGRSGRERSGLGRSGGGGSSGGGGGGVGAWVIHRLDRDVSGLLVFAKTHEAYLSLKDQLKRRQVHRRYLAVVAGELPITPAGQWKWIDSFLKDGGPNRPVQLLPAAGAEASQPPPGRGEPLAPMRAVTYYRVLAAGHGRSLLAVRLETGRKHQIRAHLAGAGHAIVGDRLYGRQAPAATGRLALHAWELAFSHPVTGQPARFLSPPPQEFLQQVGASSDVLLADAASGEAGAPAGGSSDVPAAATGGTEKGWDHVAPWYEGLVSRQRSDYHEELVLPGVLRLVAPRAGQRTLDVACGEGLLCRRLAGLGLECVGVDASEQLVAAARRLAGSLPPKARVRFLVGDARCLADLPDLQAGRGSFDSAVCVLALMNIDPLEPVLAGAAAMLKPGGSFTAVILHPAFRCPGQTSWGWDAAGQSAPKPKRGAAPGGARQSGARQYRRVDAYLSSTNRSIVMNPGEVAAGKPPVTTTTWHRPIQAYVRAFAEAGLLVDALEEWPSHRVSEPGPHAAEQNRARREIPMFLAIRGRRA